MSDQRRVVVTGMGVITPLGIGLETFWKRLLACESGVDTIKGFSTDGYSVLIGGECLDFTSEIYEEYIDPKEARRMDRFSLMAVVAAHEAKRQAGLDMNAVDPTRVGCIVGTGIGGIKELEEQYARLLSKGPRRVSVFTIPKLMVNAGAGNISIEMGAKGVSQAVTTACASATTALGDAYMAIRYNRADAMFSGGSEAAVSPLGLSAFAAMKALSTRNDDPTRASRPFDSGRDGFILGEGAGILLLEELEHAKARGAEIFAEIIGYGASCDAGHITQPSEDGEGAQLAMLSAIRDAGIEPSKVDYINTHGTSTPLGDRAEAQAISRLFGDAAPVISSTKGATGHLLGASGAVEMSATIQSIQQKIVPPTLNLENVEEGCEANHVIKDPKEMNIDIAMSNSFGFGGHNASLVIAKYE